MQIGIFDDSRRDIIEPRRQQISAVASRDGWSKLDWWPANLQKKKALGFYKNHARCPSLLSDRQYKSSSKVIL